METKNGFDGFNRFSIERLHISLLKGLMQQIYDHRDMGNIDSIIVEMLCNRYNCNPDGTIRNNSIGDDKNDRKENL